MAYQRPMVTVDQNMTVTPTSIERDQPAFIFGPNYQLYRYDDADEKAKTYIGSYNGEMLQKEYPGAVNPDKVDQSYTKLFGDDVVVEIAELDATSVKFPENTAALRALKGGYSQFMFSGKKYVNIDENGSTQVLDAPMTRNLAVGDVLWVEYEYKKDSAVVLAGKLLTTVTEVSYKKDYDADDTDKEEEEFTGTLVVVDDAIPESEGNVIAVTKISLVNVLDGVEFESRTKDADGKYYWQTGDKTGEKTIKVSTPKTKNLGEATLTVPDGGSETTYTLVLDTAPSKVEKGSKLTVRLASSDYSATVSAVSDKKVTIAFAGGVTAPSEGGNCTVFLTTTEDVETYGVQVNRGLEYKYNGEYLKVLSAELYATHRELLSSYADNMHSLSGAANVSATLGTIDPDNPLAMGVYMAALNAATDDGDETPPIYYMAVPSDDNDGYASVLNKASLTDKVYVLAPTTRDESVLDLVQSHVTTMSSKQNKQWRIAVASAEIATEKAVITRNGNPNAVDYVAVALSKSKGYVNGDAVSEIDDFYAFRIVQSASDTDANDDAGLKTSVVEGDKIRFNFHTNKYSEVEYDTYEVKQVVNNSTVIVKTSDKFITPLASNTPGRIEIYHEYTKSETADVIARTSKQFGTRRMVNVYPSHFKSDGVLLTGEFAACAVAGLISATEPQQPITNVSVRGIDDIELTYSTYSKEDLDTIAAGGTFIVAQDLPEDEVYVRHQITTAYADGNLNTGELSVTKNVDSISYAFAEVFRPYYGKYNITDDLLKIFENLATQLISQFGGSTSVYGPQLIADETKINYVRQNELMKDHVDISITLGVPYPCNNIDIVLTV